MVLISVYELPVVLVQCVRRARTRSTYEYVINVKTVKIANIEKEGGEIARVIIFIW